PWLNEILDALDHSAHGYVHEKDEKLPDGDIADFIRSCAARAIAGHQPVGLPVTGTSVSIATIGELAELYLLLRRTGGLPDPPGRHVERQLAQLLNGDDPSSEPAADWIDVLAEGLGLDLVAESSPARRDREAVEKFRAVGKEQE